MTLARTVVVVFVFTLWFVFLLIPVRPLQCVREVELVLRREVVPTAEVEELKVEELTCTADTV